MRGTESLTAARPYTGPDKASSQTHPRSVGYKHSGHPDRATSSGRVDLSAISGQTVLKHKRVFSTPKRDPYASYKRFIQYDMFKDSKAEDFRVVKPKIAKTKSEKITDELKTSQYICVGSYNKLPKRSKTSKKENSDKTIDANVTKIDEDRHHLDRRSRTFVVDSQNGLLDSRSLESLHRKIKSRHLAQSNTNTSNKPDHFAHSKEGQEQHTELFKPSGSPKEVTSSVESQSEDRMDHDGRRFNQWDLETDSGREGAKNPVTEGAVTSRPKSAGQLRYFEIEDSDESSLDGEIEIVDIDKELANDPEPSPYWSQTQPMQVPEVFVQANPSAHYSSPWSFTTTTTTNTNTTNTTTTDNNNSRQNPQPAINQYLSTSPHYSHSHLHHHHQHPRPQRLGHQRHGSGESDLSAFSDTVLKPSPPKERRRFLSEPEILPVEERATTRSKSHGKTKKTGRVLEDSRSDVNDSVFSHTTSVIQRGRERLYSDTMERVLSRYSELGLRDVPEDVSAKGRASRLPVSHHHASGHARNSSGSREGGSGYVMPPRKLKPILKHPRNDTDAGSSS